MQQTPKRILVAEDNPALSGVIRFNLEHAGYEVTAAVNGREAWELACQETFDVVVTDQQMPEMSGCELAECLQGSPAYSQTPVIMLTAKGLELDLERLRDELGIAAMLAKPFSPVELIETIGRCLAAEMELSSS